MSQEVYLRSRKALRSWLLKNHKQSSGIWLIHDKGKNRTMSSIDITKEALCFGWIDSKPGKVDATRTKIYISPRKPKSNWSAVNKRFITELQKKGLLHVSGKASVALAKKMGTWYALDEVEKMIIPKDLEAELRKYREAKPFFDAFPRSVKRGILEWILNAKTQKTRDSRIKETARQASTNTRANQYLRH